MSNEEFSQKRFPVLKLDDHYCLLTIEPLDRSQLPNGLQCYDIQNSGQETGPGFYACHHVPDLYRRGRILCKEDLPLDGSGTYHPRRASALSMAEPPTAEEFLRMSAAELAGEKENGLLYLSSFGPVPVYPVFDMYRDDDNLYMGMDYFDEEEQMMDHFASITVNIDRLPYLQSTIDTNNNGQKILDFLQRNGFGTCTGRTMHSGFCLYPVFQFEEEALHRMDPDFFRQYAQVHGRNPAILAKTNLTGKIQQATERSGTPSTQPSSAPTQERE